MRFGEHAIESLALAGDCASVSDRDGYRCAARLTSRLACVAAVVVWRQTSGGDFNFDWSACGGGFQRVSKETAGYLGEFAGVGDYRWCASHHHLDTLASFV